MSTTRAAADAREERITAALAERTACLDRLAEACGALKDAHDRRTDGAFASSLTINETSALAIVRVSLDHFLAAETAVIVAARTSDY